MDESSIFQNFDNFEKTNRIAEAQDILSKLNMENFENVLLFFQNSIFVTSKELTKSFFRSLLNIIRFRSKNLDLYANLCKNIDFFSENASHILIGFLKDADFMTPSQFKFYRLCISNELISVLDVVKQISVILFFHVKNSQKLEQLIPLFLWFLPEINTYNNSLFNLIRQRLKNVDYILSQIDLLKYDDWSIFYQYTENQYINLRYHPIYTDSKATSDEIQRDLKEKSIEYCLQEDNLDKFQELTENKDLNSKCQISLFDLLFKPNQRPTYLQFAALNSSINCFKYLIVGSNSKPKNDVQTISFSHLLNESLSFNQERIKRIESSQDIEFIEVNSSSDSETKKSSESSENSKSETDDDNDDNDDDDVIFIDDSENSDEEKQKKANFEDKEVIVISDSSTNSDEETKERITKQNNEDEDENEVKIGSQNQSENSDDQKETEIKIDSQSESENENEQKDDVDVDVSKNQNDFINIKEIDEKSTRLWMPPIYPGIFTSTAGQDSINYHIRNPLCSEYSNSMKLSTTSQCAVAGGNHEIVRNLYDSELSFFNTPRIAISCFYNSLAKWIIEVVLSPENDDESSKERNKPQNEFEAKCSSPQHVYSNLLHYSITSGNLEMMKYAIMNMPNEINDRNSTLGLIPLFLAIKYHQVDVLSFLLNLKSVDVNIIDREINKTPFFYAVDQKSLSMVKLITAHPLFDFNLIVCDTLKPIHYVALYGTSKILKYFISLNAVDVNDNTIYKIEDDRRRISRSRKIKMKKIEQKKKNPKKSRNFIDDSEFLFIYDENSTVSKNEEEEEEEINESNVKLSNFYFNYKSDLYDFDSRNYLLSSQNATFLINTPISCSLIVRNIENFYILVNDKNIDLSTRSDQMPLQICISLDMMQIFDYLLSSRTRTKLDIDGYDKCGTTALHYAILRKKKWAIEMLLKNGCDVLKKTLNEGDTVCHLAAYLNSLDLFKLFINEDESRSYFDVNVTNNKQQTPLHYATIYGSTEIVDFLLTFPSIEVNFSDVDGNTPLHHCVQSSQLRIFEKLLLNHSIDVNAMNNDQETPLIFAFKYKNVDLIRKLLALNGTINPNCIEKNTGNTPLHLAVLMKNENIIRIILKLHNRVYLNQMDLSDSPQKVNYFLNSFQYEFEGEADVNSQNFDGLTPLHIAAETKNDMLVRVLLMSPKIQLNIVDFNLGRCPLHYAAITAASKCWFGMKMFNPYMYDMERFSNTIFTQLINRDPLTGNLQDENGDTPFHIALNDTGFDGNLLKNTANQVNKNGFDEILKLNLVNVKGENYLHLAAASGNRIVLDYMIKTHPELINERTVDVFFFYNFYGIFFIFLNNVPLHYATMNGKVEMVAILMLNEGIDKFAINNLGKTPLEMARHDMRTDFEKYFVNK